MTPSPLGYFVCIGIILGLPALFMLVQAARGRYE